MRIKKVALIGAFLLTLGCIILYLILDETLPHDVRQVRLIKNKLKLATLFFLFLSEVMLFSYSRWSV